MRKSNAPTRAEYTNCSETRGIAAEFVVSRNISKGCLNENPGPDVEKLFPKRRDSLEKVGSESTMKPTVICNDEGLQFLAPKTILSVKPYIMSERVRSSASVSWKCHC
jgi:hypothetical protein